jgi:hypothetical protein
MSFKPLGNAAFMKSMGTFLVVRPLNNEKGGAINISGIKIIIIRQKARKRNTTYKDNLIRTNKYLRLPHNLLGRYCMLLTITG